MLASFLLGGPRDRRGNHGDPRLGRLSDAEARGLREEAAGGLLAAGGLGAILSPPVLGAAAFLIAEFLKIWYLDVMLMATVPTLLYYLSMFLMVELDSRRFGLPSVAAAVEGQLCAADARYWYHFVSLVAIVVFMVWASRRCWRSSGRRWSPSRCRSFARHRDGLAQGRRSRCAMAPGSAQRRRDLRRRRDHRRRGHVDGTRAEVQRDRHRVRRRQPVLTALYTALIVWVIGLAVPVTASYIICAVMVAPAMMKVGVPDFAAHMFIFYYAVLSEVWPPTALSPFAAAAITGGDPYRTTMQSWKYTLPAFVVPFMFVLDPAGVGLLLKAPPDGSWMQVALDRVHGVHRHRRAGRGHAEMDAARTQPGRALAVGRQRAAADLSGAGGGLHRPRRDCRGRLEPVSAAAEGNGLVSVCFRLVLRRCVGWQP